MDKITHQVRAEHGTRILNECMNSGMPKTAWCRANGISEKQFFYWQRIMRREAYEASQNPSLPAVTEAGQLSAVQHSVSFAEIKLPAVPSDASSGSCNPERETCPGNLEFSLSRTALPDRRDPPPSGIRPDSDEGSSGRCGLLFYRRPASMVWAAAGNMPEQNKNNKCVNWPPGTAIKKYAGTYDLPCTFEETDISFILRNRKAP